MIAQNRYVYEENSNSILSGMRSHKSLSSFKRLRLLDIILLSDDRTHSIAKQSTGLTY